MTRNQLLARIKKVEAIREHYLQLKKELRQRSLTDKEAKEEFNTYGKSVDNANKILNELYQDLDFVSIYS